MNKDTTLAHGHLHPTHSLTLSHAIWSSIKCHTCTTQHTPSQQYLCFCFCTTISFHHLSSPAQIISKQNVSIHDTLDETSLRHLEVQPCQLTAPLSLSSITHPLSPRLLDWRDACEFLMALLCLCVREWMGSIGWESTLSERQMVSSLWSVGYSYTNNSAARMEAVWEGELRGDIPISYCAPEGFMWQKHFKVTAGLLW